MKKLKNLNQNDLDEISDYLSSISHDYVLSQVSSKELIDMDINIDISYDNEELDVDMDINIDFDELSKVDRDIAERAIDYSLSSLNSYLDDNFRV